MRPTHHTNSKREARPNVLQTSRGIRLARAWRHYVPHEETDDRATTATALSHTEHGAALCVGAIVSEGSSSSSPNGLPQPGGTGSGCLASLEQPTRP